MRILPELNVTWRNTKIKMNKGATTYTSGWLEILSIFFANLRSSEGFDTYSGWTFTAKHQNKTFHSNERFCFGGRGGSVDQFF